MNKPEIVIRLALAWAAAELDAEDPNWCADQLIELAVELLDNDAPYLPELYERVIAINETTDIDAILAAAVPV